ncbi:WcbI family polysaccharide biosynthesis putative acetyltransferase [Pullulanibacillus sp. KACC 23026]|uniref:WcbI family polysaccharide biosynthesis putative acetyltransferase n=1 Tax=Pullulanibacillus sp. KACC 23026 TaxID=3028315 RepID=UPI0023AFE5CE|nr:WcbI family polysaccharide biosynthesis putative acetyltransferase [Pullulanibacillus sp. KACC 23026]WEG10998.1 WcbI family polysaccharide biosynthesis putative acetyltransferase [Pullulanibacillus sp. KACC 23026]
MKKKCIVYGNCQIGPIRQYLMSSKSFRKLYKMIEVPPVHLCDRKTGLTEAQLNELNDCDLFIYQKVSDTYGPYLATDYLLEKLPDKCQTMTIPVSYFTGYHPQFAKGIQPYADKNIIHLLRQGKCDEDIISIVSDENFYTFEELQKNVQLSLNELKKRSNDLDVTLDDFIERYYKNVHLFFTVNHPNFPIIRYVSKKILAKLGLPADELTNVVHHTDFRRYILPIYPSVMKHLNLTFAKPEDKYSSLHNIPLNFHEHIAEHIKFLKENKQLYEHL